MTPASLPPNSSTTRGTMNPTAYIETSVISYLTPDRHGIWWSRRISR